MIKKIIVWTMHESPALQHVGLAIIRISFGVMFLIFGYKKLLSGSANITQIGSAMGLFGFTRGYMLYGYLAALTELFGGLSFIVGFCTRIASLPLIWLLIVALRFHIQNADPFTVWGHAVTCLCVVIAFFLAGSGAYSIDHFTSSAAQEADYR